MKLSELTQPTDNQNKPKMKLSDLPKESVASEGWGYLINHPVKSVMQGLPETLTGKSLPTRVFESSKKKTFTPEEKEDYKKKWGMYPGEAEQLNKSDQLKYGLAEVGESALSPSTYALPLAGELAEVGVKSAIKAAAKTAPKVMESAAADYAKALGPKTIAEKSLASKVTPELVKKKPFVWTRAGLKNAAERNELQSANELEKAYDELPKDSKFQSGELIKSINKEQNSLLNKGVLLDENKPQFNKLDAIKKQVISMSRKGDLTPQEIRGVRQVYDTAAYGTKKIMSRTGIGSGRYLAQKFAGDSIRKEMASQFPSVAKINEKYTFWRNLSDLLETTVPKGKSATSNVHAFGAEHVGGHPYIGVFVNLQKLFSDNVAWNTFSGSMKSRLADLLAKGKDVEANSMIADAFKKVGKNISLDLNVAKNMENLNAEKVGKISAEPMITERPNQYTTMSQKEWPTMEKFRDGVPLSAAGLVPTLGHKNNNPGNLKATQKWEGMTGKDSQGHAIFKNKDLGIRALVKDLQTHKRKHPNQTLNDFMNTYAEKNGTEEANFIASKIKISPNTKMKDLSPYQVAKYLSKIESKENVSDEDISRVRKNYNL